MKNPITLPIGAVPDLESRVIFGLDAKKAGDFPGLRNIQPSSAPTEATFNKLISSFRPHSLQIHTPAGWVTADTATGEVTMMADGSPVPQEAIDDVLRKLGHKE